MATRKPEPGSRKRVTICAICRLITARRSPESRRRCFAARPKISVIRTLLAGIPLFCTSMAVADDMPRACATLPASLVSTITGKDVHAIHADAPNGDAGRQTCRYSGDHLSLSMSLIHAASEAEARRQLAAEFDRSARGAGQLLRGVGAEARYGTLKTSEGGIVVARFGTTVMVLRGSPDQPVLVKLARAVAAKLSPP